AHSTQAVVAHRLDYTPEVVVIQRGGLPRVATQYPCFRCGQLTRDQRVISWSVSWGRHKSNIIEQTFLIEKLQKAERISFFLSTLIHKQVYAKLIA
ncbi:hypothetical protein DWW24_21715, partial [Odoribacter splanchnicus]